MQAQKIKAVTRSPKAHTGGPQDSDAHLYLTLTNQTKLQSTCRFGLILNMSPSTELGALVFILLLLQEMYSVSQYR